MRLQTFRLFQPTPPTRTETFSDRIFPNTNLNFNPLRPRGRRPHHLADTASCCKFQPTPPARTETDAKLFSAKTCSDFNPLRPRGRRRLKGLGAGVQIDFNPLRPRGRRHNHLSSLLPKEAISTHSAREDGDVLIIFPAHIFCNFNPLRPRGRRPGFILFLLYESLDFNPLRPRGRRHSVDSYKHSIKGFQPTPPARTETREQILMI